MDLGLKGRTALITGGASGIGLATARAFAEEGCALVLWDILPRVEAVAQEIAAELGVAARGFPVDIVDFSGVERALQTAVQDGAQVDHVVHCAATGSTKFGFPFTNLVPEDWKRTLDINILGMVNVAHAAAPYFVQAQRGTFVFLASVAGQIGRKPIRRTAPARRRTSTLRSAWQKTWRSTAYV